LSDGEIEFSNIAYEELRHRVASRREGDRIVEVGPTGAAKILFALRPHALVPWDGEIMDHFTEKESVESYGAFLGNIRSKLEGLSVSCERNGFSLIDLPRELGRPHSTVPKLIDEYLWVTVTRGIGLPKSEVLRRWLSWSE
jgi:hypothetical protein